MGNSAGRAIREIDWSEGWMAVRASATFRSNEMKVQGDSPSALFGRRDVKTRVAGPTMRAIVAAAAGRILSRRSRPLVAELGDSARSGVFRGEINGITMITTNFVDIVEAKVESRLTWQISHSSWSLKVIERRRLGDSGAFEKAAPYSVSLEGDLAEAARFLDVPRELFFGAAHADGWTASEITIARLRWLDMPCANPSASLNLILRLL